MNVILNGASQDLASESTVEQALARLTSRTAGVAIAVNDTVVARGEWSTTVLRSGDRVEIVVAVQGG